MTMWQGTKDKSGMTQYTCGSNVQVAGKMLCTLSLTCNIPECATYEYYVGL